MDDFLIKFNQYTNNKYPYLRIKKVDIFSYYSKASIYFYVPDKIYENGFDNNLQKDLADFCRKISPNIRCEFYFERLILTEDLCKDNIEEFCITHYPYVASSINSQCLKVNIGDTIIIDITLETDVFDVVEQSDFAENLILYIQELYIFPAEINFNVVEKGQIKIENADELVNNSKKVVPVESFDYLCGINYKQINRPLFIDAISRNQDKASVCGYVDSIEVRENKIEEAKNPDFFKKYSYKFVLDDRSGKMSVYFKTDDEKCPLKEVKIGDELLIRGKVIYNANQGKYLCYAKSVYTCKLDIDKIKEALKPLPPPEKLILDAEKYQGNDFIEAQTLDDYLKGSQAKTFDCIFLTYNSLAEDKFLPWDLTMLSFVDGKCDEVYSTYVKVANLESIDPEYKSKVNLSKRLIDIVGDIICFTKGKQIVCRNPQSVVSEVAFFAKQHNWKFDPECIDADKVGMKVSKGVADMYKNLKNNGIVLKDNSSYSQAIALAKLYIKVKK